MTTPHPTPEERYEAIENKARNLYVTTHLGYVEAVQTATIAAIREAEAAGEARGRAMERNNDGR